MKKTLTILFVFTSFFTSAQKLDSIRGAGFIWERGMFNKSLGIPTFCGIPKTNYADSTKKAQIGYDSCAGKFYTYNPATETWSEPGGAGSGVDSVTLSSTGCVKTFSTWSGGTESVIGTVTQPNGLAPGTGIATKTTGTTFTVTAATYTINCITYQSRDTTITLPAAGDTGRIDVIKVNTFGVTTQGTGTEGEALASPSLSDTELALTYVLVTDTGVTVSLPTDTALWVSVGNDIRNANAGAVHVTTSLQLGNYTRGSWLTSGAHTNTYFVAQDGFYLTNPANSSLTKTGISQGFGNAANFWAGGNIIGSWRLVGNTTGNQFNISSGYNPASGGGEASTYSSTTTLSPTGANSINYTVFDATPTYTQGAFGTGALRGFRYKPTIISLNTSRNIAFENISGDIIHRNLAGTGTRMVVVNDTGLVSTQAIPGGSTSDTIYVDAPLEAYTSGDSNKIRINPDTLAAWRNNVEPTFTIDLSLGDYTITEPGIYIVTHGEIFLGNAISFPDPTTMPGASITILNNDTLDNYNADYGLNKPLKLGNGPGGEWTTLVFPEMHTYKSIGGYWHGGSYGQ